MDKEIIMKRTTVVTFTVAAENADLLLYAKQLVLTGDYVFKSIFTSKVDGPGYSIAIKKERFSSETAKKNKLPCRNTVNKIIKKNKVTDRLVDKWIVELLEAGYNYDEMMPIFRLAKKKAELTLEKLIS